MRSAKIIFICVGLFLSKSYGASDSPESAWLLRQAIELSSTVSSAAVEYKLPVTRALFQGNTELCWAYAFLSALESNYLVQHPWSGIELSRGAMQFFTVVDRINISVHSTNKEYVTERGTALDAAYLTAQNGAIPFREYHDIQEQSSYDKYNAIEQDVERQPTEERKQATLNKEMSTLLNGAPPAIVNFPVIHLDRHYLGQLVLGKGTWHSYAISKNGQDYDAADPDPDGRRGAQTHFTSRKNIEDMMISSLKNGHALIFSNIKHLTEIYGVALDVVGKPTTYYMKDSEAFGFYEADPVRLLDELGEITVLDP